MLVPNYRATGPAGTAPHVMAWIGLITCIPVRA